MRGFMLLVVLLDQVVPVFSISVASCRGQLAGALRLASGAAKGLLS
jgi:hypothetical protein